jgi:thioredoxin 1
VDEMREISSSCGVRAMPTFQFYKNGNKCDEQTGADKSGLETRVKKHYVEVELPEEEKPQPKMTEAEKGDGLRQRKAEIVKVKTTEEWKALQMRAQEAGKTVRGLAVGVWVSYPHWLTFYCPL